MEENKSVNEEERVKEEDLIKNKEENGKKQKTIFTKEVIIALAVGLLIGIVSTKLTSINLATLATIKGKAITKNQIYNKLENNYTLDALNMLLEETDKIILSKKYQEDGKMKAKIKEEAEKYISSYSKYYKKSEEDFLKENGFKNIEDFAKFLSLDYKRNLYYYDYLASLIGEDKIQKYYDENVYGTINTKHVLVKVSEKMLEGKSQEIAKEIIVKLAEKNADFDKIVEEYKKEYGADTIVVEDLGYLGFTDRIETPFMDALKSMENNSYSKEPVKTSYGYHVIYRKDQKEKPTLEDVKTDIIDKLASETDIQPEPKMKKLIDLRKEEGLKISNSKFAEKYKELCDKYEEKQTEDKTQSTEIKK